MYGHLLLLVLLSWIAASSCAPVDLWIPHETWDGTYTCPYPLENNVLNTMSIPLSMTVISNDVNTQRVVIQVYLGTLVGEIIYISTGLAIGNSLSLNFSRALQQPLLAAILNFMGSVSLNGISYKGSVSVAEVSYASFHKGINQYTLCTFILQRSRTYDIHACGMTLNTGGVYNLRKDIIAPSSLRTPCISVTSDAVVINSTNSKISSGDCSNCTGILVTGKNCQIWNMKLEDFAVGINVVSADNMLIADLVVSGTRVLNSAMGILAANTRGIRYVDVQVLNLASYSDVYGLYFNGTTNTSIYNLRISNLTSFASSPGIYGRFPESVGVYADGSDSFIITIATISQISGTFAAYGIKLPYQSHAVRVIGCSVSRVTASEAGATATGYYLTDYSNTCTACTANTIVADSLNATASGFVLGGAQILSAISASNVIGDLAYGVQSTVHVNVTSIAGFTIDDIHGTTEAYGLNLQGPNTSISSGAIRRVISRYRAHAISAPYAVGFSVSQTTIALVQGTDTYGILLGSISDPSILDTTIFQVASGINVYFNSSKQNDTCSVNLATQVCYPSDSVCCSNCSQVLDQCGQCGNKTCDSGQACVAGTCYGKSPCLFDVCGPGTSCTENGTSFYCIDIRRCAPDYCGTGMSCVLVNGSHTCVDMDECASTVGICPNNTTCINVVGSHKCKEIDECAMVDCGIGFYCQDGKGTHSCEDINECKVNDHKCSTDFSCENTVGSFACKAESPSLVWFNYSQSQTFPYYANFSWSFKEGAYNISHYLFSDAKSFFPLDLTTTELLNYSLPIGAKYIFYIAAVDTHGFFSDLASPIVIKNLSSGAVCKTGLCLNKGVCGTDGVCACVNGWSGPYCNYKTSNVTMQYEPSIPRVKMNDISSAATYINVTITELYELNSHGQVQGKNVSLGNVDYNYTLIPGPHQVSLVYQATLANNAYVKFEIIDFAELTEVSFAGRNFYVPPNTIKLNIVISAWPFSEQGNQLAITLNISFPGILNSSELDYPDAMSWLTLDIGGAQIYANFMDSILLDGRLDTVNFVWNNDGTITIKVPYFTQSVEIDPNFSVLVGGSNTSSSWQSNNQVSKKSAILIGTVVSGLFVVFVAIVVLRKRIISTMEVWWGWNRNTFTNEDSVEL